MTFNLADFGIDRLNRDERIALASDILLSVTETSPSAEMPPWLKAEVDQRIDAYERNPENVLNWEDVKAELNSKYAK